MEKADCKYIPYTPCSERFSEYCKSGKRAIYIPAVTKQKYFENYAQQIVDDSYEGSLKNFVSAFTNVRKLTESEKEDLINYIKGLN